jgi:hypothetical protein
MKSFAVFTALVLVSHAGPAKAATVVHFLGPHPVAPSVHRGMCFIEGPHVHSYVPHKKLLYVRVDDGWSFIGDPTEYDRHVKKHAYYGHHPVFWVDDDGQEVEHYCYITGPHHHLYRPPPTLEFKVKGGVYWYVGAHPRWYKRRARRYRHVDRYYARVHIVRPVVTVVPPVGFVGVVVGPGHRHHVHGHVAAGVHLAAPRVEVRVPAPTAAVVIGGHRPHRHQVVVHEKRRGPPAHAPAWGYRGKKHGGGGKWKPRGKARGKGRHK